MNSFSLTDHRHLFCREFLSASSLGNQISRYDILESFLTCVSHTFQQINHCVLSGFGTIGSDSAYASCRTLFSRDGAHTWGTLCTSQPRILSVLLFPFGRQGAKFLCIKHAAILSGWWVHLSSLSAQEMCPPQYPDLHVLFAQLYWAWNHFWTTVLHSGLLC